MLRAKNLHKSFHNGKKELKVLKGIDLAIGKGNFVSVVGPSGAGKSTLLHILGGLDEPSQGEVFLEDQSIYKLNDSLLSRTRNEKIGFVFQFFHLLPEFNAIENVLMPAYVRMRNKAERIALNEQAGALLHQVGLEERRGHFPNQLSGGEKQRLAIIRALINQPQLLFCDEPTGNLDSKTGMQIVELIRKISSENQMSVLLVTHNQELAALADRVYHLKDGNLVN